MMSNREIDEFIKDTTEVLNYVSILLMNNEFDKAELAIRRLHAAFAIATTPIHNSKKGNK